MQKLLALVVLWSAAATLPQPAATGLSEAARLVAVHETILQARFNQARTEIARACPPAPSESCLALTTAALWWEIQLDPNNRRLDKSLQDAAATAIDAADRWTRREPQRAEAWFYLAVAHAPLEEWRILRGQRLAAARDARGLKDALDRTLTLDPTLEDAYFGVGLYHYYGAVAPATIKFLRWLLLMPGGNREEGMREMQRARDRGALLRGEADYHFHLLYLWYEHQPARALDLLRGLDARYPTNPLFVQRIAEVERDDIHDHAASMAAWQMLLDRATDGRVEFAAMSAVRARIGLAQELVATSQARRAIDLLAPTMDSRPSAPYGADALVHFARGRAYEQLDDRDRAAIEWRQAITIAPSDDPDNIRSRARSAIARLRR